MNLEDFERCLQHSRPPKFFSPAQQALWWAAKDRWDAAHDIVMAHEDADCAWVHAHLHRVEGDLDNARYWYHRAGKGAASGDLAAERDAIVATLIDGVCA